jgi:serine/threonine-protein kinase ATR
MAGAPDPGSDIAIDPVRGNGPPPPSILAAQLVDNISSSTKPSRSDDNAELKGLFAIIQRVKDDPDLLKTADERLEHNHMLIYVYCRVVLEAIKLDDPFLDKPHVRAEALKAINFLRFTINETPSVLCFASSDHGLLYRGQEPLWIWMLPQLLRMLGHPKCAELEGSIEGFLQYLLLVVARTGQLWKMTSLLALYYRGCLTGLIDHLQSPSAVLGVKKLRTDIELPPAFVLDQVHGSRSTLSQLATYHVTSTEQALSQAQSLSRVLAYPLTSQETALAPFSPTLEIGPWLLDAWLDLRSVQKRLDTTSKSSPLPLIDMAVDFIKTCQGDSVSVIAVRNKAYTTLVLLCSEMVASPDELTLSDAAGDKARLSYSIALVIVSQAALQSSAIARLAASKLVQELTLLSAQYPVLEEGSDLWVGGLRFIQDEFPLIQDRDAPYYCVK